MLEVKCVGRGGQGAVTFSQLLAIAAFEQGYPVVQAMPSFGVERRGAPSFSFTRLSKKECVELRSLIYKPDVVVILDPTLIGEVDVTEGVDKGGIIIVNSKKNARELGFKPGPKIYTVDASSIALKIFGEDIINTAMLGAFAKITKEIELKSLEKALWQRFEGNTSLIEKNQRAIKEVYDNI